MQIEQRLAGDVAIISVDGEISLQKGSDVALKDKVQSLLQQGYRKILLDLAQVAYVDSAGLGQLVQVYTTSRNSGAAMKLVGVTKRLNDLLVVTKLVTVFDSYDTQDAAIASFSPAAGG